MPMLMIESWEEFAARHGGNSIEDNGRILFADGAMTDTRDMMRWEPPTDPTKRLKNQKWYWQAMVERAEVAFNNAKNDCENRAHWHARGAGPGLTANDAAVLKELKNKVTTLRRSLAKIVKQLADTPEEQMRRRMAENEALIRQQQSQLLGEIRAIEL